MLALLGGKKLSRRNLLIVALAGLLVLSFILFFLFRNSSQDNSQQLGAKTTALVKPEKVGLPKRLKIPKIKVDAAVEYVGVTSQGDMDVPEGPAGTAWYKLGPRPGEVGSAVIDGHYGRWINGGGSVFDNLNKLHKGDKIYIVDKDEATITFVVQSSRKYDPEADTDSVFKSNDGKSHLNLITCQGDWNQNQQTYSTRLVVFANKVE